MSSRVPAARWVATITVVAVLMVLTALAVRMKLGDDPAVGTASASTKSTTSTTTSDTSVQELYDDSSSSSGSSSAVPSSPSTSQAS
jgi:hypothetical protein